MGRRTGSASHVANGGKPIEQFETDDEGQLLAGESVYQSFEHCRKPRRLHAAEPISQFSQPPITMRQPVPLGKIDA